MAPKRKLLRELQDDRIPAALPQTEREALFIKDGWARSRLLDVAALLLFLLPMLAYWAYCLILQPAPNYAGIDPEYEYFLNSLSVFKHQTYAYVDHPGTPVEMIGSAILAATYPWLAGRPEGFAGYYVRNPRLFLQMAYGFLVLAHLACMLAFFRIARRKDGGRTTLLAASLATMYFAIQPYAFSGSLLWSHNSFSFAFGTLVLLWLYASIVRTGDETGPSIRTWVGLGLGVGILAAITIFLASWAVGVLTTIVLYYGLLGRPWKELALAAAAFGLSSVAGFYLAVLPVINRMGGFWNWIYSILSHQSNYLAVPKNQGMIERVSGNLIDLFHLLPVLFVAMVLVVALGCAAVILWRGRWKEQPALWSLAAGLTAQMIALTLVFLDRPLRAYYFLGVAAIVPVLAIVLFRLYEHKPEIHRIMAVVVSLAVLIGLVVNLVSAIFGWRAQVQMQARSQQAVQQAVLQRAQETGQASESLTILWMYGAYSDCWALWFGNHRAGDAFDPEITQVCPNQYELAGRVLMPNSKVPLEDMKWDIVFTCERYTDTVLAKQPGAEVRVYPDIEWACGKMAAVFNR